MFTSFTTALSGLTSMTKAIDVVGNNLANLNTTGYKNHEVAFKELVAQALDGTASTQVGLGVSRPTVTAQYTQGSIQTTSGQYDAAIDGNGFFVVSGAGKQILYTRDGSFNQDKDGYLITLGGQRVQGWMSANGAVNTNGGLSDLQIPVGQTLQSQASTKFSMSANLDSSSTPTFSTSVTGVVNSAIAVTTGVNDKVNMTIDGTTYNLTLAPADATIAAAATDIQTQLTAAGSTATATVNSNGDLQITSGATGVNAYVQMLAGNANGTLGVSTTPLVNPNASSSLITSVDAIDSLRNKVPVSVSLTKETAGGRWSYAITAPGSSLTSGITTTVATGHIEFDNAGNLVVPNSLNGVVPMTISGLADGAANLNLNWNLYKADGTPSLTQYSATSSVASKSLDGQAPSELNSVSIGDNGQILATYSDGNQVLAGQLAIANIGNPQSMIGVSSNNFGLSAATAAPTIGAAGTGGRGTVQGGALESSTVDIATEFSNLLTYERSYQADSRVVTVSDDMTQAAVNLIK